MLINSVGMSVVMESGFEMLMKRVRVSVVRKEENGLKVS